MNKYTPVSCEAYGNYELAILRGTELRLCWRGARELTRIEAVVPINLRTRAHGEFLLARTRGGVSLAIRLDRIVRADTLDQGE